MSNNVSLADVLELLKAEFPAEDVKYKPGKGGKSFAYIDARAVMDRLDEVVGPENWSTHFIPLESGAMVCELTVLGVTKSDAGETGLAMQDKEEAAKAAASDAFKRAAVHFGVGRYLYEERGGGGTAAPASSGGGTTSSGTSSSGGGSMDFELKFTKHKGKKISDPSIDDGFLQWLLDKEILKNQDGTPNEFQRKAVAAELERRKGGAAGGSAAPANEAPSGGGEWKPSAQDLNELLTLAKGQGKSYADVKQLASDNFGKNDPKQLTQDEFEMLKLELA